MSKPKVYFWTETISLENFVEIRTSQGQLQGFDMGETELTAIKYKVFGDLQIAGMQFVIDGVGDDGKMSFDCLLYTSPSPRDS